MHLLVREISPYTAVNRLLGVFRTLADAEASRTTYLRSVVHGANDPWVKQAYRRVSDADVVIVSDLEQLESVEASTRVFVVTSKSEALGQVVLKLEAISGSEGAARKRASELEAQDDGEFPFSCDVHVLEVGELRLDA